MATADDHLNAATVADAAYIRNLAPGLAGEELLSEFQGRLTRPVAQKLALSNFAVRHQSSDTFFASGFSATVFAWGGNYYFGIRGTESVVTDPRDLSLADRQIAISGLAKDQAVDLYRYWRMITTPNGARVQYSTSEIDFLFSLKQQGLLLPELQAPAQGAFKDLLAADKGLGILRPDDKVIVGGHSLGGHLVQVFTQFFPGAVQAAYTFNGAGFGGALAQLVDIALPGSVDIDSSIVQNIVADHGADVTAGLGVMIGGTTRVFNETGLSPIDNHFMEKLTDSLALYSAFYRLDPSFQISAITDALDAASNVSSKSLETSLDGLRAILSTSSGIAPTNIGDRAQFNENVLALLQMIDGIKATGALTARSFVRDSSQQIAAQAGADNGIAYRYALQHLLPFAVNGLDYGQLPVSATLELSSDAHPSGLTKAWITDRAELLAWVNVRNVDDAGTLLRRNDGGVPMSFSWSSDGATRESLHVTSLASGILAPRVDIYFGSTEGDHFTGGQNADHIYGEAGDDELTGGLGDDYLEGGAGNDRLIGGSGNDWLAGGLGDDYFDAGAGRNRLEGGVGNDTYLVSAETGSFTIADSDGIGQLILDGVQLTGGTGSHDVFWNDAHSVYFTMSEDDQGTVTLGVNGNVTIADFHPGQFGITLVSLDDEPADTPPVAENTYTDSPVSDAEAALAADDPNYFYTYIYGSPENDSFVAGPDWGPYFIGRAGDDLLVGGERMARLFGGPGDDEIVNHIGTPDEESTLPQYHLLVGGVGDDHVVGSDQGDLIYGDFYRLYESPAVAGRHGFVLDERLWSLATPTESSPAGYASSILGGDFPGFDGPASGAPRTDFTTFLEYVFGDAAPDAASLTFDDDLEGGDGDDVIVGGAGSDFIEGGAGDDLIYGNYGRVASTEWIDFTDADLFREAFGDSFAALFGTPGNNYIDAGDGDDHVIDDGEHSSVVGGAGNDTIEINAVETVDHYELTHSATIDAGDGDDTVIVRSAWVSIDAGDGNDEVRADGVTLTIDGGAGNDHIQANGTDGWLEGGSGNDVYVIGTFGDARTASFTIYNHDTAGFDRLELSSDPTDFSFYRDGDDLVLENDNHGTIEFFEEFIQSPDFPAEFGDPEQFASEVMASLGYADIRIPDWFLGADYQIDVIAFGLDYEWTPADIEVALVDQGDSYLEVATALDSAFDPGEPNDFNDDPGPTAGGESEAPVADSGNPPGDSSSGPAESGGDPGSLAGGAGDAPEAPGVDSPAITAAHPNEAPAAVPDFASVADAPPNVAVARVNSPQQSADASDASAAAAEMTALVETFFARNTPPELSPQQWVDTWFTAGSRSAPRTERPSPDSSTPAVPESAPVELPASDEPLTPDEVAARYDEIDRWLAENPGFSDDLAAGASPYSLFPLGQLPLSDASGTLDRLRFGSTPGLAGLGGLTSQRVQGLEGLKILG